MLTACMCNIYWKLRLESLQLFYFLPIYKKLFEILDQGLSTCCFSVLYSDIMLCFNHANVVTLRFYGSKLLSLFEKPINSSKTEFCLPLGQCSLCVVDCAGVRLFLCGITQENEWLQEVYMNTTERKKNLLIIILIKSKQGHVNIIDNS